MTKTTIIKVGVENITTLFRCFEIDGEGESIWVCAYNQQEAENYYTDLTGIEEFDIKECDYYYKFYYECETKREYDKLTKSKVCLHKELEPTEGGYMKIKRCIIDVIKEFHKYNGPFILCETL